MDPGNILRVDLSSKKITREEYDQNIARTYVGGTGIGARILYDEVPPGVGWSDPSNRLIVVTGPLTGTKMGGSGLVSVVTKGCLTDGATASQAGGYLGAFLKFNGFLGLVFQGTSNRWVYLYIHDGEAELRDAEHLLGLDTWTTETTIKGELGKLEREMSVFSIGLAGENLVKFAAIVGDGGHVAAHNGCGAVMGSKRLKAIAVSRGKGNVTVHDKERFSSLAKQIHESIINHPTHRVYYEWGTSMSFSSMLATGRLPVKNMNTNVFPEFEPFLGQNYRRIFELTPNPCWACRMHHCHKMKATEGPYAGYAGDEPEYECWAAWGPLIGQTDPAAAFMLSNEVDRLGMDTNEAGWLIAFVMDCYERGIFSRSDTDGIEMTWGNSQAALAMLQKIAKRDGFGNILAEGVKRAAEQCGGEAIRHAAYIQKGHAPRGHDHRARWSEILDCATSGTGTIESSSPSSAMIPPEFELAPFTDPFSPDQIAYIIAKYKPRLQFLDCLVLCLFTAGQNFAPIVEIVNAATGWDLTLENAIAVAMRNVNLLRAFNIRHGIGPEVEAPSEWYSSTPVDGPARGKSITPYWDQMLDIYYRHMGWDRKSGRPLPETLRNLGLEKEISDLW